MRGRGRTSHPALPLTQDSECLELFTTSMVVEGPGKRSCFWKLGCYLLEDTMNRFERCEIRGKNISIENC